MLIDTLPECSIGRPIWYYNTYQGWVKRRNMYATQSFTLLHASGIIRIHIFWVLSKYKQKENIKYKYKIYSYKHQSILSFLLTLYDSNLFWCLHLRTRTDHLFNKLQSSRDLIIKTFPLSIIYSNLVRLYC